MKQIVYLLSGALLFLSCNKDQNICKEVFCTMEVRSYGLVLRTSTGTIPPSVDYCETYLNGRLLKTSTPSVEGSNSLVQVVDDSHRTKFTLNKAETIQVRIFQQGAETKEVSIGILADCCHINRLSGPDTVIVL
jgi:hypothetical protein